MNSIEHICVKFSTSNTILSWLEILFFFKTETNIGTNAVGKDVSFVDMKTEEGFNQKLGAIVSII